ncbi:ATP synthase F1 subunit epsilon [Rapidithrix thailandica]|uniref:ATP synthase F1 subunit epsilon n=1 Tax=Rapidithrix thailandica TaxID=413964 RepID=A0AAW9S2M7_9BACT
MYLEVVTPDKKAFEGEVKAVKVPGSNGSFEVLNNHAPVISTLTEGQIRITTKSDVQYLNIDSGILEMLDNKIVILAEAIIDAE